MARAKETADNIASAQDNEGLEHSVDGVTTRHDALDLGVPMMAGDPSEPQGPEDALGPGPKRGDYSSRVGPSDYQPHITVPNPEAGEGEPTVRVVAQREWAGQTGDSRGKGGVSTDEAARTLRGE